MVDQTEMIYAVAGGGGFSDSPVATISYTVNGTSGTNCTYNATTSTFSSVLSSAQSGQTICLAAGSYGTFSGGIAKSSPGVMITAASGVTASMSLFLCNNTTTSWLIFDNIRIVGGDVCHPTTNIMIQNSTLTDELQFWQNGNNNRCSNCSKMNNENFNINTSTLNMADNPVNANDNGRLSFWGSSNGSADGPAGIVAMNSVFAYNCDDGMQFEGGGIGVVIGPGNTFHDLLQGNCPNGQHEDSIQWDGGDNPGPIISGNFFYNDSDGLVPFDNAAIATITNNVFRNCNQNNNGCLGGPGDNTYGHSFISHNTVSDDGIGCGQTHEGNICTMNARDNIMTGLNLGGGGAGAPSYVDYNDCIGSQSTCNSAKGGTHNLGCTPTYVGGSSPTTYAGFRLTPNSCGHAAASDGNDLGINISSGSGVNQPVPPTNVTILVQ